MPENHRKRRMLAAGKQENRRGGCRLQEWEEAKRQIWAAGTRAIQDMDMSELSNFTDI